MMHRLWRKSAASAKVCRMDSFEIAGEAAALLEAKGYVACARRVDGKTTLDCWVHQPSGSKQITFSVGDDELSSITLTAKCAAWIRAHALDNEPSGPHH